MCGCFIAALYFCYTCLISAKKNGLKTVKKLKIIHLFQVKISAKSQVQAKYFICLTKWEVLEKHNKLSNPFSDQLLTIVWIYVTYLFECCLGKNF